MQERSTVGDVKDYREVESGVRTTPLYLCI